jgi:hypothetical protein
MLFLFHGRRSYGKGGRALSLMPDGRFRVFGFDHNRAIRAGDDCYLWDASERLKLAPEASLFDDNPLLHIANALGRGVTAIFGSRNERLIKELLPIVEELTRKGPST